jgi:hypothetical protein
MRLFLCVPLMALGLLAGEVVKEADAKALTAIVSFLSDDSLEGRDTPSAGLTISAHYIASEFRRAGLAPAVGKSYLQEAKVTVRKVVKEGFTLSFSDGSNSVAVPIEAAAWSPGPMVDLQGAGVTRMTFAELTAKTVEKVEPVVILEGQFNRGAQLAIAGLSKIGAQVVIVTGVPIPVASQSLEFDGMPKTPLLLLRITKAETESAVKALTAPKATVKIAAASESQSVVYNVIGKLEGSDAALKEEYVALSAHYDHLGVRPSEDGDKVYNGANDNASGVASVIESARLIGQLAAKPKRSILFIAYFGEERGLLGSRYLTQHPVVPLAKITANINLEQTGRTDSSEGPNVGQFNLTGYHFTTLHKTLEQAGAETDIKVVKHGQFSDPFFTASDNAAFAAVGVPSTTVSVTYQFPDYHQRGDEWEKIDFANMAKVTRAIAQGTYLTADAVERTAWNADEPKTKSFREAAAKLNPVQ